MANICFHINRTMHKVDCSRFGPEVSLNDYIRSVADLRGTKAMCHEGGCGACVVAVTAPIPPEDTLRTFAVNSCLVSVLSCHGWDVTTVEGIGNRTMGYHLLQTRLASFNGTQCGFCTPGWVMNMYSLLESSSKPLTSTEIENSFAGNMCRCTGYRPIADAFKTFASDADQSLLDKIVDLEDLGFNKSCGIKCSSSCRKECSKECEDHDDDNDFTFIMDNKMLVINTAQHTWFRAYSLEDIFSAMKNGEYKLIAGNTGQGVYHVTEYPPYVIDIFNVSELKCFSIDVNLILGAGMTLSDIMALFQALAIEREEFSYLKQLYDHLDLVAHIPVKNIGTIGGNLFLKYLHNEFQSDLFLILETVGAMMTIAEGVNKFMKVNILDFLGINMKGKVIVNIMLPPLSKNHVVKTYKIMPRSQNAHAIVNAGFMFKFFANSTILDKLTIAYGGISPTFVHAKNTEALLSGKDPFTDETLILALNSLANEVIPMELPPEPSARYRNMLAVNLYYKAILCLCPEDRLNYKYRSGGEAIKRITASKGSQSFETDKDLWPLNQPVPKLEALVQCSGEATFANDLPTQVNEVFAAFVTADILPGSIIQDFDDTDAKKLPGFITFYSAKDIPGSNDFTPGFIPPYLDKPEEILCEKEVKFYGQPAGIVVADTEKNANKAAKLVKITYKMVNNKKPLITITDVLNSPCRDKRVKNENNVEPTERGGDIDYVIDGEINIGSQYHYHMETQVCVVNPTEDGMDVYSATQWLDLPNIAIARCLNIPENRINIIVRRVGGAFGAKISRSSQIACAAALVTHLLGRTCRFILSLTTNMKIIGKRIASFFKYEVGVDKNGVIQYLEMETFHNLGYTLNESLTVITLQALYNSYEHKRWKISTNSVITDTPSHTWCRAPYNAEGLAVIEHIMDKIAHCVGKDPIDVRLQNINKKPDYPIPNMIDQAKKDADYDNRIKIVADFNKNNRWRKRAIKLVPLSFDVSFIGNFNALISIYHDDGTVCITHGGIEMGQGINTKAAQVCAYMLGVSLDKISVKPGSSITSPNAIFTRGSTGSESVALAVIKACEILNKRLEPFKEENPKWEEMIEAAYKAEVDLQASYMVAVKKDNMTAYTIYAIGIIEIEIDILTGNHNVLRVDILEDTGRSLSPEIDVAQIEGAFIMGLGYWTCENLVTDKNTGRLLTDRTWTYKIPGMKDIPADMRVSFRKGGRNEVGVLQSKATGEPALCLGAVFSLAVREAVRLARLDAGYPDNWIDIENPCTVENIFMAIGHQLDHFKLK